jgi:hypothetical protein
LVWCYCKCSSCGDMLVPFVCLSVDVGLTANRLQCSDVQDPVQLHTVLIFIFYSVDRKQTSQCRPVLVLTCMSFGVCPFKTYGASPPPLSLHMQKHRQHTSAYEFKQVDIVACQETESPPSGPLRTDSSRDIQSLNTVMMSSMSVADPVNCTVVHKCLPVCLLCQTCSCAICIASAVPQMCLNCICSHSICALHLTALPPSMFYGWYFLSFWIVRGGPKRGWKMCH